MSKHAAGCLPVDVLEQAFSAIRGQGCEHRQRSWALLLIVDTLLCVEVSSSVKEWELGCARLVSLLKSLKVSLQQT